MRFGGRYQPSGRPSINRMFCTAAPDAPLPGIVEPGNQHGLAEIGITETRSSSLLVSFSASGSSLPRIGRQDADIGRAGT